MVEITTPQNSQSAYNSGNYNSSLRRSKFASIFYGQHSWILQQSAMRLRRFGLAAKVYRKASSYGWVLRDHFENQFRAEYNSGNWIEAFLVASSDISEEELEGEARW